MPPRLSIPTVFAAGGALGFGYYLVMRQHWFPDPRKTQGMQNIEDRYTAGGAAPNHQPGTSTPIGDSKDTSTKHVNGGQGPDSAKFDKSINDQKGGDSGVFPKKFYEGQYDNPKGK